MDKNKKFNYIYIIVNFKRNMIYVGKHSTNNLDDNYFGSGTLLKYYLQRYDSNEFYRYIIDFTDYCHLDLLEEFYISYFKNNFNGVLLNLDIPNKKPHEFYAACKYNCIPFWQKSYAFLFLINDRYDKFTYLRKKILGSYFITSIFEFYTPSYSWKSKETLILKNFKFQNSSEKLLISNEFQIKAFQPLLKFNIPEIKINLINTEFSEKNVTGYFQLKEKKSDY